MAGRKDGSDIDIMALLAEVHGGSDEDVREGRMADALATLEATHRQAARALRDLNTEGMRRQRPDRVLPAHSPVEAPSAGETPPAQQAVLTGPPPAPEAHNDATRVTAVPTVEVQTGEGAAVDMGYRTLTHIVRPNRGRK